MDDEINEIIDQILLLKDKFITDSANLSEEQLNLVLDQVSDILKVEPTLLNLDAPITIVGNIHGQLHDLMRIFEESNLSQDKKYLFLGGYVDRGFQSIETMILLFCYKILFPDSIFLLRGSHELKGFNREYGFYNEITSKFLKEELWEKFNDVFNYLPLAATINDKIFCVHAGISSHIQSLQDISNIPKPITENQISINNQFEKGIIPDLICSEADPTIDEWRDGDKNASTYFGKNAIQEFKNKFGIELIIRAHQMVENGIDYPFDPDKSCVTLFSATKYRIFNNNKGAIIHVDENLQYTSSIFDPVIPKMTKVMQTKFKKFLKPK